MFSFECPQKQTRRQGLRFRYCTGEVLTWGTRVEVAKGRKGRKNKEDGIKQQVARGQLGLHPAGGHSSEMSFWIAWLGWGWGVRAFLHWFPFLIIESCPGIGFLCVAGLAPQFWRKPSLWQRSCRHWMWEAWACWKEPSPAAAGDLEEEAKMGEGGRSSSPATEAFQVCLSVVSLPFYFELMSYPSKLSLTVMIKTVIQP